MKIVCIGDSITYGYGVERELSWVSLLSQKPKQEIINKGIPGNTTAEMLNRFSIDVSPHKPSGAMILGGTNDILLNIEIDVQDILDNITAMVAICRSQAVEPIILTPLPVKESTFKKTWFKEVDYTAANRKLTDLRGRLLAYCQMENILAVDVGGHIIDHIDLDMHFLEDGIHVSPEVHREIAAIVCDEVLSFL